MSGKEDRKQAAMSRYEEKKRRMAADPEYAAKIKAEWKRANKNRYKNETPEQREKRLERKKISSAKRYQEWKAKQPPKQEPKPKSKPVAPESPRKKPGRLMALAGWHRW